LSFLPAEFLPLVIVVVALGIITGLLRVRTGFGIIAGFVLSILLAPFVGMIFDQVPWWLNLLMAVLTGIALLQAFIALFIGDRASDTMAGSLAADMVRFMVRAWLFPLRLVGIGLGAIARRWILRGY
jgi:predicted branched-subunit amino acid permease